MTHPLEEENRRLKAALGRAQNLIRDLGGQHGELLDQIDAALRYAAPPASGEALDALYKFNVASEEEAKRNLISPAASGEGIATNDTLVAAPPQGELRKLLADADAFIVVAQDEWGIYLGDMSAKAALAELDAASPPPPTQGEEAFDGPIMAQLVRNNAELMAARDAAREYGVQARLREKAAEDKRIHDTDALRAENAALRQRADEATGACAAECERVGRETPRKHASHMTDYESGFDDGAAACEAAIRARIAPKGKP